MFCDQTDPVVPSQLETATTNPTAAGTDADVLQPAYPHPNNDLFGCLDYETILYASINHFVANSVKGVTWQYVAGIRDSRERLRDVTVLPTVPAVSGKP
jgi:hypothetical protein